MVAVREVLGGRYELLEVIGRGGMGVVFRAMDRVLEREVAVKVLPAGQAVAPTFVARFAREARAAASLNHPNVVGVFDVGQDADTRFIVMEYVAGQTLAQLVRQRGRLDPAHAVKIVTEIADALGAAHAAGIVHRDIKPANVILDARGFAKVLDFGIARAAAATSLTQTAVVLGSAPYMAPEVARGERADARSDIYSLGCVLYELLTGGPPFTGEFAAAVLHQHATASPRPPRELNPDVGAMLDALVLRMLAKDPSERPQPAARLVSELRAALLAPTTQTVRLPPVPNRSPARTGSVSRQAPVDGRTPQGRLALAGLGMLVLAALLFALLSSPDGGRRTGAAATTVPTSPATVPTSPATVPTSPATASTSPATVPSLAGALTTLIAQDLQSGAIDRHGSELLNHLQDVLGSYEQAHADDALHKLDDLNQHLADLSRHGDIQASALLAINVAIGNLRETITRAAPVPINPAGAAGSGGPDGQH